jgi:L-fuconolactonase
MSPAPTRRDFLGTASAALLAGASAPPQEFPPIIDTHVHLWDLSRFHLAWLEGAPTLNRNFLWEDYRRTGEGLNIVKGIYMEVDVDPSEREREAKSVVELCRRGDTAMVAAVISGRPASDTFAAYIRPLSKEPAIKGLRQVLHAPGTPAGYCLDRSFVRGIQLLGELGLSFDLCPRPGELGDAAKLAELCPGTRFILDHCGNADVFAKDLEPWRRGLAAVAKRPNVCGKVSGIIASTRGHSWRPDDLAPVVNHVLSEFGPDRVVFGGDWPVCTLGAPLAQWVEALRAVVRDRGPIEQRKLFHDNALRIYRLI